MRWNVFVEGWYFLNCICQIIMILIKQCYRTYCLCKCAPNERWKKTNRIKNFNLKIHFFEYSNLQNLTNLQVNQNGIRYSRIAKKIDFALMNGIRNLLIGIKLNLILKSFFFCKVRTVNIYDKNTIAE